MAAQFADKTQELIGKLTKNKGGVENEAVLTLLEAAADLNTGFIAKQNPEKMRVHVLDAKTALKLIENQIG